MNPSITPWRVAVGVALALAATTALAQVSLPASPTRLPTDAAQAPVTELDPTTLQQAQAEVTASYADSQRPSVTLRVPLQVENFDATAFPPEAGVASDRDVLISCRLTLRHPDDSQRFHQFVLTGGLVDALARRDVEGMYTMKWYLDDASTRDFVAQGLRPSEYACKLAPSRLDQEQHQLWSTNATLCDWNVQGEGSRCFVQGTFTGSP